MSERAPDAMHALRSPSWVTFSGSSSMRAVGGNMRVGSEGKGRRGGVDRNGQVGLNKCGLSRLLLLLLLLPAPLVRRSRPRGFLLRLPPAARGRVAPLRSVHASTAAAPASTPGTAAITRATFLLTWPGGVHEARQHATAALGGGTVGNTGACRPRRRNSGLGVK